jgi:folate-dependent phosphoribosylglycinamide formyltransferase PurN
MSRKQLRVIVLTQGGCEFAIERLLQLDCAHIAGIFIETDIVGRRSLREKIVRSVRYDGYASTVLKFARKLLGLGGVYDEGINAIAASRDRLRELAAEHAIPIHFVDNYHTEHSRALMEAADSDLGIVLGTNILRESVFSIPRLGSINLHQGLAPYYRGGPSIFWELSNGEREVGLTIHYVASKVDTGDIIVQRTVPLEYDYSYQLDYEAFIDDYRQQLKMPSASLIAEAVQMISDGTATPRPQDASLGKRYKLPVKSEKDQLRGLLRERRRVQSGYALAQKVSSGD